MSKLDECNFFKKKKKKKKKKKRNTINVAVRFYTQRLHKTDICVRLS